MVKILFVIKDSWCVRIQKASLNSLVDRWGIDEDL